MRYDFFFPRQKKIKETGRDCYCITTKCFDSKIRLIKIDGEWRAHHCRRKPSVHNLLDVFAIAGRLSIGKSVRIKKLLREWELRSCRVITNWYVGVRWTPQRNYSNFQCSLVQKHSSEQAFNVDLWTTNRTNFRENAREVFHKKSICEKIMCNSHLCPIKTQWCANDTAVSFWCRITENNLQEKKPDAIRRSCV